MMKGRSRESLSSKYSHFQPKKLPGPGSDLLFSDALSGAGRQDCAWGLHPGFWGHQGCFLSPHEVRYYSLKAITERCSAGALVTLEGLFPAQLGMFLLLSWACFVRFCKSKVFC